MIKQLDNNLEIEKTKKNALEQYGWWAMLEVLVYPTRMVKTALILFTKFAS